MNFVGYFAKDTSATFYFTMVSGVTPQTAVTVTLTMAKNGASTLSTPGAVVTEVGSGVYKCQLKEPDTNTLGTSIILATGAGCDNRYILLQVVTPELLDVLTCINTELSQAGLLSLNEEVRRVRARINPREVKTL